MTEESDPEVTSRVEQLNALSGQWRAVWRRTRRTARRGVALLVAIAFYLMGLTPEGFVWREALVRVGEGVFVGVSVALLIGYGRRWRDDREREFDRVGKERERLFGELKELGYPNVERQNFVGRAKGAATDTPWLEYRGPIDK